MNSGRIILVGACVLLAFGCAELGSSEDAAAPAGAYVRGFSPEGTTLTSEILVRFSEPIADRSLDPKFPPVVFTPTLDGRFVWKSSETLAFLPSQEFPPNTRIAALVVAGARAERFSFQTPLFSVRAVEPYVTPKGYFVRLVFSHAVEPSLVPSAIRVESAAGASLVEGHSIDVGGRVVLVRLRKKAEARVYVAPFLRAAVGTEALAKEVLRPVPVPQAQLQVLAVEPDAGGFELRLSADVDVANLEDSISILWTKLGAFECPNPTGKDCLAPKAGPLRVSQHGTRLRLEGDFVPGRQYGLKLNKGVVARTGWILASDFERTVSLAQSAEALGFSTDTLTADYDSDLVLSRGGTLRARLAILEYGRAASRAVLLAAQTGKKIPVQARELRKKKIEFGGRPTLSLSPSQLGLKVGRAYRLELTDPLKPWVHASRTVLFTRLRLSSHALAHEWVAAVSKADGTAVSGAEFRLLSPDGRTLALGYSDAEGVCRVPLSEALRSNWAAISVAAGGDILFQPAAVGPWPAPADPNKVFAYGLPAEHSAGAPIRAVFVHRTGGVDAPFDQDYGLRLEDERQAELWRSGTLRGRRGLFKVEATLPEVLPEGGLQWVAVGPSEERLAQWPFGAASSDSAAPGYASGTLGVELAFDRSVYTLGQPLLARLQGPAGVYLLAVENSTTLFHRRLVLASDPVEQWVPLRASAFPFANMLVRSLPDGQWRRLPVPLGSEPVSVRTWLKERSDSTLKVLVQTSDGAERPSIVAMLVEQGQPDPDPGAVFFHPRGHDGALRSPRVDSPVGMSVVGRTGSQGWAMLELPVPAAGKAYRVVALAALGGRFGVGSFPLEPDANSGAEDSEAP